MENTPKVALVTGANKGIGHEIARRLAGLGLTVFAAARDRERGEAGARGLRETGLDVRFVQLDVTSAASILAASRLIDEQVGRLDVLVNNAGMGILRKPPAALTADDVRTVYETNVFGVIAVTQAMLPLLERSAAGRIVNISSTLGSLTAASDPHRDTSSAAYATSIGLAYSTSKTALNAVTVCFANQLRATNIKVNAACPGHVATDLNGFAGKRTVEQGAREPVRLATLDADGPTGGFFDDDGPKPW
jgi:NAD(P)-dependent dehydrogenase (short-subunit alcohol dehydrogenase family)